MRADLLLVTLAAVACDTPTSGTATSGTSEVVAPAELVETAFVVEGMTCASCEVSIRTAAGRLPGVHSVEVDHASATATVGHDPEEVSAVAIAEAITDLGYPTRPQVEAEAASQAAGEVGFDPAMAAICEAGCAARIDYAPEDVVAQPGAQVGDLAQCPVSGVVFAVQEGQPTFEVAGEVWFTCCGMCQERARAEPARFVAG